MLEIEKLSKRYKKTLAVDNVSFTVETGRVGILLGPNGAGKSTIIKCISSLLRFMGSIRIHGKQSKSIEAKKVFAYVPEIPALYENLTVREHLVFVLKAYDQVDDGYADTLLKRFDLEDKQDKLGSELSKGMMQKVSICCALLVRPKVILLDEPMVGLDPKAIKELKNVILELKEQGTTILISTHMLDMVEAVWDDMFVMDKGKLIATYRKEDVKGEELNDLFFSITEGTQEEEVNDE
ncbi:MAG: ABC transporter ATP-binding protein [Coprobacillaceae bacterium]